MLIKQCTICKETKDITEFNKKRKSYQSYCKECQKDLHKKYYESHKQDYIVKAKKQRDEYLEKNYLYIKEYLEQHPCIDCGNSDIEVLEFDHIRDKKKAISVLMVGSTETLKLEIEKCEVRCTNCHRKKTIRQLGFRRSLWGIGQDGKASGSQPENQEFESPIPHEI